jgi:hypothetical protein
MTRPGKLCCAFFAPDAKPKKKSQFNSIKIYSKNLQETHKHIDFIEVERVKGIEPSSQAWEAHILPLDHTRYRS